MISNFQILLIIFSMYKWIIWCLNKSIAVDFYLNNKNKNYLDYYMENTYYYLIKKTTDIISVIFNEKNGRMYVFNLLCSLLGKKYEVFYSIQLLSIIFLNKTTLTVFMSLLTPEKLVKISSVSRLILIGIVIFTFITYNYMLNLVNDSNNRICSSLAECFFKLITNAFITGDGLFLDYKSINTVGYYTEIIITWPFYFFMCLILISMINGIMVDSFLKIREDDEEKDYIINNVCFTCNKSKYELEEQNEEFIEHITKVHPVRTLIYYINLIHEKNYVDCDYLEKYVKECIEMSNTSFIYC